MSGPCFSASVGGHPLRSPTRLRLGKPLPYQLADGTQAPPKAAFAFHLHSLTMQISCGISSPFELLSLSSGQVTNALLTRSPLSIISNAPFDLHVLSTPPAFILSQDQTLRIDFFFIFRCLESFNSSNHRAHISYHSSVVKVLYLFILLETKRRCHFSGHRLVRPTNHRFWSLTQSVFSMLSAICPVGRNLVCSKCVLYYTHRSSLVKGFSKTLTIV